MPITQWVWPHSYTLSQRIFCIQCMYISLLHFEMGFKDPNTGGGGKYWLWSYWEVDAYQLKRFHAVYNVSVVNTIYYFSMLQILKFCLQAEFIWNVSFWLHALFGVCHNWSHAKPWVFIHLPPNLVYKIYVSIALFHTPECSLCAVPFLHNWSNSIKKNVGQSFCRVSVGLHMCNHRHSKL